MTREQISALLPHAGEMVLLDQIDAVTATTIVCSTTSHLRPENPLRRHGCLASVHAIEYGAQAAALHGALQQAGRPTNGYLGSVKNVQLLAPRLDTQGTLIVQAEVMMRDSRGAIYNFAALNEAVRLATGRFTIIFT